MKKPISFLFTISLLLLALCTLISCVPTDPAPEEHTHEY